MLFEPPMGWADTLAMKIDGLLQNICPDFAFFCPFLKNTCRIHAGSRYYNTTGVKVSGTIRQRPQIVGYARFNGLGGFDPNHPSRLFNRVFECVDPCVWQGQNKLLFKRMLNAPAKPDGFLMVVRRS